MNTDDGLITTIEEALPISLPVLNDSDIRDICLRQENRRDLEAIQRIIMIEEDRVMSLDEVLSRVLGFYGRFVPFKETLANG